MTSQNDAAEFTRLQRANAERIAADPHLQQVAAEATRSAHGRGYSYVWRWLGVPIIQMPADVVALQEVVWETRPQVIVETGVARGGSLIFFSSILQLIGEGEVVGIDIDIRSHNRQAIEEHPLSPRIHLIEGSSVDPRVAEEVRSRCHGAERVMVVLDSNHAHDHVLAELRLYAPLVTTGQFLVVADTVVDDLAPEAHATRPWGVGDSPRTALDAYLGECDRFERDGYVNDRLLMTCSPGGYLRCLAP